VGARRAALLRPGEPRERECAEHQPEVAQRDVAVAAGQQQVDDDAAQPAGHEQAPVAGRDSDYEARRDLDDADRVHRILGAAGDEVVELRGEIGGPVVVEDLGELVEAEQDRCDRERDPQQQEGLLRW